MSLEVIRAELETKVKAWADAQTPPIPVAFENVGYTKPADGQTPFLETFTIPNTTMNKEVSGSRKTYLGIFQVNCWAPKNAGTNPVNTLAQSIIDLFPLVPKTGSVSIEQTPSAGRLTMDDSNWVIRPVMIRYRYEATN
jgi:hypothetical protein